MKILDRYILRQILFAWISMSAALIAIAWLIRFLNSMNLVTSSGQSIVAVFRITLLVLPEIAFTVLPITLFLAFILVIRRLNQDSELAVMNAAGLSPATLARPFYFALILSFSLTTCLSLWLQPSTLAMWRESVTQAGADLIATILEPGRFSQLGGGMVFHFRERTENGDLLGIVVKDGRNPQQSSLYMAEKGSMLRNGEATFLILENGTVQERPNTPAGQVSTVRFERYNINFSEFAGNVGEVQYKIREYGTLDLINRISKSEDPDLRPRLIAELHMRLSAPFYPIAFGLIAIAFLLEAQTVRQSRSKLLIGAIGVALAVRVLSLNFISDANKNESLILLFYLVPLVPSILAVGQIHNIIPLKRWLTPVFNRVDQILLPLTYWVGTGFKAFKLRVNRMFSHVKARAIRLLRPVDASA